MTHQRNNSGPYSPTQCAYAMARLMERIVSEGYVRDDRAAELLERARNQEHGRGFRTDAELAPPKPPTVEDLLA